jgi:hypothetical protein
MIDIPVTGWRRVTAPTLGRGEWSDALDCFQSGDVIVFCQPVHKAADLIINGDIIDIVSSGLTTTWECQETAMLGKLPLMRGKRTDLPAKKGTCETCAHAVRIKGSGKWRERGYEAPCVTCRRPEMSGWEKAGEAEPAPFRDDYGRREGRSVKGTDHG